MGMSIIKLTLTHRVLICYRKYSTGHILLFN